MSSLQIEYFPDFSETRRRTPKIRLAQDVKQTAEIYHWPDTLPGLAGSQRVAREKLLGSERAGRR
ncbi:hypothetical protein JW698_01485 [Candidatus Wolfebacteria bacterium]|nr:hypothetical protein [Candidatus Wolfebacteria bacterium]